MVVITKVIGGLLVATGIIAYLATGMDSVTALAPAILGVILVVLGMLAGNPDKTRTMMHVALVASLLGVLASLMPLRDLGDFFAGDAERPGAVVAAGLMAILCVIHLALGVRSFIAARSGDSPD